MDELQARAALDGLPGLWWHRVARLDLPAVAAFLEECATHDDNPERMSQADLAEYFDSPRSVPAQDVLVGLDADGAVGAMAWAGCNRAVTEQRGVHLGGAVHPRRRREGIGRAVLAWELAHGRAWDDATRAPGHGPLVMRMLVPTGQGDVRDLAVRHGLAVERYFVELSQRLDGPVQVPPVAGTSLCDWDTERSAEVHAVLDDAFREHWGHVDATPQTWQESIDSHTFRPRWSILAVDDATGAVVGVALNVAYEQDWGPQGFTEGYTDQLGVLAGHRGRGIATALLLASMQRFRDEGLEAAGLGADSANASGAGRLYESLGYRRTASTCIHQVTRRCGLTCGDDLRFRPATLVVEHTFEYCQAMTSTPPTAATVRSWVEQLRQSAPGDDVERVEQLRALEELSGAAAGRQGRISVDLDVSQRAAQQAAGVPARDLGRGVAAQIGLARRYSPNRAARLLGLARVLAEMPNTYLALNRGQITEWRATIVARETACLTLQDRAAVDTELAALPGGLEALGDLGCEQQTRRIAHRLDPAAATRRAARACNERGVSLRPAPDTMTYLSGLLPVKDGVGVLAALHAHANTLTAGGDARTRGQIMADTLVERVTGVSTASALPVEVRVVITEASLLEKDPTPAHLDGYGPLPAAVVRGWISTDTTEPATGVERARVWIRRLHADTAGRLIGMDSHRRRFPDALRSFITTRDQTCRTPWCDAPIRHVDHVDRHSDGGPTNATNGQGLCTACNQAKEATGWSARATDTPGGHEVRTTTPTGHTYRSRPPPTPGSPIETHLHDLVLAACGAGPSRRAARPPARTSRPGGRRARPPGRRRPRG